MSNNNACDGHFIFPTSNNICISIFATYFYSVYREIDAENYANSQINLISLENFLRC